MRILFTNDDGYDSYGIHAVADLFSRDYEIAVVAPDVQKSGFSHSLTLEPNGLTLKEIGGYGYKVYAVGGTPVDCVKIAFFKLFVKPDVVISGINNGLNLGSDVMYSGTIAAATDAAHLGARAIALSCDRHGDTVSDCKALAKFIFDNFALITSFDLPPKTVININYPSVSPRGAVVTKMSTLDTFKDGYVEANGILMPCGKRDYTGLDRQTDEALCRDGYITVTPLKMDRTDYTVLENIGSAEFVL